MLIVIGFSVLCLIFPSLAWAGYLLYRQTQLGRAVGRYMEKDGVTSPIVEFTLPDGQKVTFEDKSDTSGDLNILSDLFNGLYQKYILKLELKEGDLPVHYDPKNPRDAHVASNEGFFIAPVILFLMGFCVLLYAIPATSGLVRLLVRYVEN